MHDELRHPHITKRSVATPITNLVLHAVALGVDGVGCAGCIAFDDGKVVLELVQLVLSQPSFVVATTCGGTQQHSQSCAAAGSPVCTYSASFGSYAAAHVS